MNPAFNRLTNSATVLPCRTICGNGHVDYREECDFLPPLKLNPGCNATRCWTKPKYNCTFDPFDCQACGDGMLNGNEGCDGSNGCSADC